MDEFGELVARIARIRGGCLVFHFFRDEVTIKISQGYYIPRVLTWREFPTPGFEVFMDHVEDIGALPVTPGRLEDDDYVREFFERDVLRFVDASHKLRANEERSKT